PSTEDLNMTKKLVEASKYIDIPILDHLIIAGDRFTSLAQMGHI
ncbi:MAG: JAB domain-containing protein, partial [Candidatus Kapaibacteriota bacterium]